MYYGNGYQRMFCAGDLIDADDEAVKGRENFFQPVEDFVQEKRDRPQIGLRGRVIERATAEPGEKRSVSPKPSQDEKPSQDDEKPAGRRTPAKAPVSSSTDKKDGEV